MLKYQYRENRLQSFQGVTRGRKSYAWKLELPSAVHLADAGFYFSPTQRFPHQITCFYCGGKETTLKDVTASHLESNPECVFSKIQRHLERALLAANKREYWTSLSSAEIVQPHCDESVGLRRATFRNWPHKTGSLNSANMAKLGFFFCPMNERSDRVICMYCDCPLEEWSPHDDPLEEHKKNLFNYCHFLLVEPESDQSHEITLDDLHETRTELRTYERKRQAGPEYSRNSQKKGLDADSDQILRSIDQVTESNDQLDESNDQPDESFDPGTSSVGLGNESFDGDNGSVQQSWEKSNDSESDSDSVKPAPRKPAAKPRAKKSRFDSDLDIDIEAILKSPPKKRKLRAFGAQREHSSVLDDSNQNVGEYNTLNLSYMETDVNVRATPVLQTGLSTKFVLPRSKDSDAPFGTAAKTAKSPFIDQREPEELAEPERLPLTSEPKKPQVYTEPGSPQTLPEPEGFQQPIPEMPKSSFTDDLQKRPAAPFSSDRSVDDNDESMLNASGALNAHEKISDEVLNDANDSTQNGDILNANSSPEIEVEAPQSTTQGQRHTPEPEQGRVSQNDESRPDLFKIKVPSGGLIRLESPTDPRKKSKVSSPEVEIKIEDESMDVDGVAAFDVKPTKEQEKTDTASHQNLTKNERNQLNVESNQGFSGDQIKPQNEQMAQQQFTSGPTPPFQQAFPQMQSAPQAWNGPFPNAQNGPMQPNAATLPYPNLHPGFLHSDPGTYPQNAMAAMGNAPQLANYPNAVFQPAMNPHFNGQMNQSMGGPGGPHMVNAHTVTQVTNDSTGYAQLSSVQQVYSTQIPNAQFPMQVPFQPIPGGFPEPNALFGTQNMQPGPQYQNTQLPGAVDPRYGQAPARSQNQPLDTQQAGSDGAPGFSDDSNIPAVPRKKHKSREPSVPQTEPQSYVFHNVGQAAVDFSRPATGRSPDQQNAVQKEPTSTTPQNKAQSSPRAHLSPTMQKETLEPPKKRKQADKSLGPASSDRSSAKALLDDPSINSFVKAPPKHDYTDDVIFEADHAREPNFSYSGRTLKATKNVMPKEATNLKLAAEAPQPRSPVVKVEAEASLGKVTEILTESEQLASPSKTASRQSLPTNTRAEKKSGVLSEKGEAMGTVDAERKPMGTVDAESKAMGTVEAEGEVSANATLVEKKDLKVDETKPGSFLQASSSPKSVPMPEPSSKKSSSASSEGPNTPHPEQLPKRNHTDARPPSDAFNSRIEPRRPSEATPLAKRTHSTKSSPHGKLSKPLPLSHDTRYSFGDFRPESASTPSRGAQIAHLSVDSVVAGIRTLSDTVEFLAKTMARNCELHNDMDGLLTLLIGDLPEEEENMTISEWIRHCASVSGQTVRDAARRMIEEYEQAFDQLLERALALPTSD